MQSRGHRRERQVSAVLRELGFLVSSRRHEGGAGDLLAIEPPGLPSTWTPLLIEVKGTTEAPWRSTWGPAERDLLALTAGTYGCEPLLAWWPPGLSGPIWLPEEDWPSAETAREIQLREDREEWWRQQ